MVAISLGLLCAAAITSAAQTITIIDAPGAGTAIHRGTFPQSINTAGHIVGYDIDSGGVVHGFVR